MLLRCWPGKQNEMERSRVCSDKESHCDPMTIFVFLDIFTWEERKFPHNGIDKPSGEPMLLFLYPLNIGKKISLPNHIERLAHIRSKRIEGVENLFLCSGSLHIYEVRGFALRKKNKIKRTDECLSPYVGTISSAQTTSEKGRNGNNVKTGEESGTPHATPAPYEKKKGEQKVGTIVEGSRTRGHTHQGWPGPASFPWSQPQQQEK